MNETQYEEIYLDEGKELTDLIQEWINDKFYIGENGELNYECLI